VLIEEGAEVAAGQVLARLDDRTARANHEVARRERDSAERALAETSVLLEQARRTRDRQRSLRTRELTSQAAVDAAEAETDALAARLETARAQLAVRRAALAVTELEVEDHVVRAPFNGVVISKDAQPGEMVSPISAGGGFTRTGIATLVDMESREIEVDVNESFINRVQPGQRTDAVLDAYPDWVLPARVTAIVPAADRQKATVRVRIAFEELEPRILPDMGVRVRFYEEDGGRAVSALLPAAAVVTEAGRSYVWVVQDRHARRVAVTPGRELEGRREILQGLGAGATVVVAPPAGLTDGARVKAGDGG
jgi:RND family efflux transporter MFP subunit